MSVKEYHQLMTALSLMGHLNQHGARFVPLESVMKLLQTFVEGELREQE